MAKVLIIDDEEGICESLSELLTEEGYVVKTARNGKIGLELFSSEPFDVILTDLIMPEQEGMETIRKIIKKDPQAKIIAMSGGGRIGPQDYLSVAKDLGAKEVIRKPLEIDALLKLLGKILKPES